MCQQFRTRDCHDIHVFLSCISQPIIESSHNVKFGCLTMNYERLAGEGLELVLSFLNRNVSYLIDQYKSAGISPWNNNWGHIHDFTTIPDGKNYSLLGKVINIENVNLFVLLFK